MTYRVEASTDAREQIAAMARFWRESQPAKEELFEAEWLKVAMLLSHHLDAGARYKRKPGVRRTLLRRTQIWVYYRVFPEEQRLVVVAVRHTARCGGPRL